MMSLLSMFTIIVASICFGVALTLFVEFYFLRKYFRRLPILGPPYKPQYDKSSLPKEILDILQDPELKNKKESCSCLNLIIQFLFRELKDTHMIRRWCVRKMNVEFEEMLQTTTGKLMEQISVRDFNLGATFPIFRNASLKNAVIHNDDGGIDELDIKVDMDYNGGFQLSMDVDLVFGKSAFLSIKITKLKGTGRLQLTRQPYTHWSFSFYEDPVMEFEVESHLEGRPIPQITSLIVNQIRRSVRKKHTLPNYKIRYKPFFKKPDMKPMSQDILLHGKKISIGCLEVTVLGCGRLPKLASDSYLYCTLAVDSLPWLDLMSSRRKLWRSHEVEIIKGPSQPIGLTFKDEFVLDKYEEMVLVESVTPGTPAAQADIRKSDVLIAIGGARVTSTKQAAKLMKQASERFVLRIERSSRLTSGPHTEPVAVVEDAESLKSVDSQPDQLDECGSDFMMVGLSEEKGGGDRAHPSKDDKASSLGSPKKGFSFLGSGQRLFHRKKGNQGDGRVSPRGSPKGSPTPSCKVEHSSEKEEKNKEESKEQLDMPAKKRSQSDVTPILRRRKLEQERRASEAAKEVGMLEARSSAGRSSFKADEVILLNNSSSSSSSSSSSQKSTSTTTTTTTTTATMSSSTTTTSTATAARTAKTTTAKTTTKTTAKATAKTSAVSEEESVDLRKTKLVKACEEPEWGDTIEFEVEDKHRFLNVCVWCKTPEKLDKQQRVVKPEKDMLIGNTSIALMDIALDCLTTLQGDTQQTYYLSPPDLKAGASRSKISHLGSHPGFDEKLCYGDITLEFTHSHGRQLTRTELQTIHQREEENQELFPEEEARPAPSATASRLKDDYGKHDFLGTQFHSATFCHFCGKKIWLKAAFQCRRCTMICHKKCTEKCQAQTICTRDGVRPKLPPTNGSKDPERAAAGGRKVSPLLARFGRKDSPKGSPKGSPGHSPKGSPLLLKKDADDAEDAGGAVGGAKERRRHSSAPDENKGESKDDSHVASKSSQPLLSVTTMPRTRSTTSLQSLLQEDASPSVQPHEDSSSSEDDSSDEDELNLLKYFAEQKANQNSDELVMRAAKEMGRELYVHLSPEERRDKLDSMITKLQNEIDSESEDRSELARSEREAVDMSRKRLIGIKLDKSDEKIQALALLMLHYCAGLQHCLDQMEEDRQRKEEEEKQRQEDALLSQLDAKEDSPQRKRVNEDHAGAIAEGAAGDLAPTGSDNTYVGTGARPKVKGEGSQIKPAEVSPKLNLSDSEDDDDDLHESDEQALLRRPQITVEDVNGKSQHVASGGPPGAENID